LSPEQRPRSWVIHPFLIAVFPIVSLYAHNIHETSRRELVAPIFLVLAGTSLVWLALRWWTKSPERAGLATSLVVALFFAFGWITQTLNHGLDYLSDFWVQTEHSIHPLTVLAILTVLVAPVLRAIFRSRKRFDVATSYLNLFALALVALPISSAVLSKIREPARPLIEGGGAAVPLAAKPERLPDIYYIILDSYARTDVLKDLFGLDNEPFLRRLEQKGFHLCPQSTSNYPFTALSLCSSLNGDYLYRLIDPASRDMNLLTKRIGDNFVINSLRPLGYKFVTFSTGFDATEHPEADVYLYPRHPTDSFHWLLIEMTPLRVLLPQVGFWDNYTFLRERTLYTLKHLPDITEISEPTFTLAHILSPHPPFVFGEHGEDVSPRNGLRADDTLLDAEHYRKGYFGQAQYITERIEETIESILTRSPEPPIIILQSDHGSGLRHHLFSLEKTDLHERLSILNCYYFPDQKYDDLTDHITPVNSFRVVLNHFFGANLPLLEERSYFSVLSDPLVFTDVTARLHDASERSRTYKPPDRFFNMLY
jgi:hypothetical protein